MRIIQGAEFLPLSGGVMLGDIDLLDNKLFTTDLLIRQTSPSKMGLRNRADDAWQTMEFNDLVLNSGLNAGVNNVAIKTANADNYKFLFQARDTGVGMVTIAQLQSGADPYFETTLPMRLTPSTEPGTLVEGHFWYDSTTKLLTYRDGVAVRSIPQQIVVVKSTDEVINSATVLQNDDELLFPVLANENWWFDILIRYYAPSAADLKYGISVPSGNGAWVTGQRDLSGAQKVLLQDSGAPEARGENAEYWIWLSGVVNVAETGGNVVFQWAQVTSDVGDTKVLADSVLRASRG